MDYILTLSCPDKPGIVHAVTGIFAARKINILELSQFSDPQNSTFLMRIHFGPTDAGDLQSAFGGLAAEFSMTYNIRPVAQKTRVLIMVSKIGHCLNDLLFRAKTGQLPIDVPVIVSNHPDFEPLAKSYGIAFHHLPVTKDTKAAQESQVLALVKQYDIELVVLARYMQVLSPTLCEALAGRAINVHHAILPGFAGAKPYHRAFDKGVKIIGATSHFVTADLDEGPIIEQSVVRVDHTMTVKQLTDHGSNAESQVLSAAVKWFAEGRVFINKNKTVVFS